jgi:hypothetical protein
LAAAILEIAEPRRRALRRQAGTVGRCSLFARIMRTAVTTMLVAIATGGVRAGAGDVK